MNPSHPRLIAIVGGSGSGKSWLAGRLHSLLGERATRLTLDDFYRDRSHLPPSKRAAINTEDPDAIEWPLFEEVLQNCIAGRPSHVPRYDFETHCRTSNGDSIRPRAVVLVDGLWLLLRPSVRRLFHLKIFMECASKLRLSRLLGFAARRRHQTAAEIRREFRTTIEPMHRRHVAPQTRWADLVLHQPPVDGDLHQLHEHLWDLLKSGSLFPAWMRETFRAELTTLLNTKDA